MNVAVVAKTVHARLMPSLRLAYERYIMGTAAVGMLTEAELKQSIRWIDETAIDNELLRAMFTEGNRRRVNLIRYELDKTGEIMTDQFGKVAVLVALLGFIIAFGLSGRGGEHTNATRAMCVAAMFALWVQMPRFKVLFRFTSRKDAGCRIGAVRTLWDEYWYYYQWLVRRENTTNTMERLVMCATLITIVALAFAFVAA